jgi:hypothetical protein
VVQWSEFLATHPEVRVRFPCYQVFWEVVGLERVTLSLVNTIEELLGRKTSGFGLESREYGSMDPSTWPRGTLCPQKLELTSPTSSGRSVSIVRPQTEATKFVFLFRFFMKIYWFYNCYFQLLNEVIKAWIREQIWTTHVSPFSPLGLLPI